LFILLLLQLQKLSVFLLVISVFLSLHWFWIWIIPLVDILEISHDIIFLTDNLIAATRWLVIVARFRIFKKSNLLLLCIQHGAVSLLIFSFLSSWRGWLWIRISTCSSYLRLTHNIILLLLLLLLIGLFSRLFNLLFILWLFLLTIRWLIIRTLSINFFDFFLIIFLSHLSFQGLVVVSLFLETNRINKSFMDTNKRQLITLSPWNPCFPYCEYWVSFENTALLPTFVNASDFLLFSSS